MRSFRKRRFTKRRRSGRTKRYTRKRRVTRRRRSYRATRKPVLLWRRVHDAKMPMPDILYPWASITGPRPYTTPITLDMCSDVASLKNMWTSYKIVKAKAVWTVCGPSDRTGPATDGTGAIPPTVLTTGVNWPVVGSYIDYDGTPDVNTLAMLMEEKTCSLQKLKPGASFTRTWVPHWLASTYYSAVSTAYIPKTGFVTMTNSGLPHYGLVWDLDYADTKNLQGMSFTYSIWIQVALRGLDTGKFQKRYNALRN